MEKGFNFYSDGVFYRYSTSIDNSDVPGAYDKDGPIRSIDNPNETVRGFTIYNVGMMQRLPDGKVQLNLIT